MAIYVVHRYGERFYGPEPDLPQFDSSTFKSYSINYNTVQLTWDPPVGTFEQFRLVRNMFGYPQSEDDGDILMDAEVPDTQYNDTVVAPAKFVYYSIFLKIQSTWYLAATSSTLHIRKKDSEVWLWDRLPIHYRMLRGNQLTLEADWNMDLAAYLAVIGWGLDKVRTSVEAASYRLDIYYSHIGIVYLLADQLGLPRYGGLSGLRQRALTYNATPLMAGRGNPETMESAGRIVSGWDVVLRPTRNLLASSDRSGAVNPLPLTWDPSIRYKAGDRVHFYDAEYVALIDNTGYDQSPAGDRLPNTWWGPLMVVEDRTTAWDSASLSQHAWQPISMTAGVANNKVTTQLLIGGPRPLDEVRSANAVILKNTHTATMTVAARNLPADPNVATVDPLIAIQHGIPLPNLVDWSPTRSYDAGSLVLFQGRVYHAVRPGKLGVSPRDTPTRWEVVGTDNRIKLTASAYTHQPHTSTGTAPRAATMFMDFFDNRGVFICREIGNPTDTRVLDTFTRYTGSALGALGGRTTEYGGKTWTDQIAGFIRESYDYGVVHPSNDTASRVVSTVNYGSANAQVAATFVAAPVAGREQALILRWASSTSYLRATRTKLQTVSGATVTDLVTYGSPVTDGDRLTVICNGNNFTVFRNGIQVGTATSTFNNTATIFGMAVEA